MFNSSHINYIFGKIKMRVCKIYNIRLNYNNSIIKICTWTDDGCIYIS